MDIVNTISQIINTVGFPIAAYLLMWYALVKEKDAHKEEISMLKEALDNNTSVLTKLYERMDVNDG